MHFQNKISKLNLKVHLELGSPCFAICNTRVDIWNQEFELCGEARCLHCHKNFTMFQIFNSIDHFIKIEANRVGDVDYNIAPQAIYDLVLENARIQLILQLNAYKLIWC